MHFIYLTTNVVNNKQYIGSHFGNENDNYLGSGKLILKAIKKYGKSNFTRIILEECDESLKLSLEEKYIKDYNTLVPNGYNVSPTGGHGLNGKMSQETKEKIRNSNLGLKRSVQTIENIRNSQLGSTYTRLNQKEYYINKLGEELAEKEYAKFIDNQRLKHLGKKHTIETKEKISYLIKKHWETNIHPNKGKRQSDEVIEKRRQLVIGQKRTEETKLKMSIVKKGKPKNYEVWNVGKTKLDINETIINQVKELKLSGLLNREIAKQLNYSNSCIGRILNGFYDNKTQHNKWKLNL